MIGPRGHVVVWRDLDGWTGSLWWGAGQSVRSPKLKSEAEVRRWARQYAEVDRNWECVMRMPAHQQLELTL